jgi:hypothetical protein
MKIAQAFVLLMSVESLIASSAFAYHRNWKLSLYWFLVAAINAVASTF